MADPYFGGQNGGMPYYGQAQDPQTYHDAGQQQEQRVYNQYQTQRRPYTLHEALPYTPFTSIFPFHSGKSHPTPAPSSAARLSASICQNFMHRHVQLHQRSIAPIC